MTKSAEYFPAVFFLVNTPQRSESFTLSGRCSSPAPDLLFPADLLPVGAPTVCSAASCYSPRLRTKTPGSISDCRSIFDLFSHIVPEPVTKTLVWLLVVFFIFYFCLGLKDQVNALRFLYLTKTQTYVNQIFFLFPLIDNTNVFVVPRLLTCCVSVFSSVDVDVVTLSVCSLDPPRPPLHGGLQRWLS